MSSYLPQAEAVVPRPPSGDRPVSSRRLRSHTLLERARAALGACYHNPTLSTFHNLTLGLALNVSTFIIVFVSNVLELEGNLLIHFKN